MTHYESPWSLGKPLFDMVAAQRNVDWDEVVVILVNDGEESRLPDELFGDYPYRVKNLTIPHGGVSRARNAGLDASDAEFVMLCDFDDQFAMVTGLQIIFAAFEKWPDTNVFWSPFIEEVPDSEGKIHLIQHGDDVVFIHGKIFRREWLKENGIRFCDRLTLHEDIFFVSLARYVARGEKVQEIPDGFWLWCNNPNSVGRRYGKNFMLHTYDHLMKERCEMTEEYLRRGGRESAMVVACKTIVDAYYDLQNAAWKKQTEHYRKAERWVCGYLKRYGNLYAECGVQLIAALAMASRESRVKTGELLMETITMGDWLRHLMNEVEPVSAEDLESE